MKYRPTIFRIAVAAPPIPLARAQEHTNKGAS